jgi:ribosomal protein L24E
MFIRNDGATFWYCSSKCRKNASVLKRDPRKLKWARAQRFRSEQVSSPQTRMKLAEATVATTKKK